MMKIQIHPECFNPGALYLLQLSDGRGFCGTFDTFVIHDKRLMLIFSYADIANKSGSVLAVYPSQIVGYTHVRENL